MSRHGDITLLWGDGEYRFRLAYGELRRLQEACDAGPPRIMARLWQYHPETNPHGDNWRVEDIRETIRLGLIGGGKSQQEALELVVKFVDGRPLEENIGHAWLIIYQAVRGTPEEPFKEKKAEAGRTEATTTSTMKKSPSEEFMRLDA